MNESNDSRTTLAEDEDFASVVLRQLLDLHPMRLTVSELTRELGGDGDFAQRDGLERAIRDLAAVGLLHRSGEFVAPTRAALRFNELIDR